MNSILTDEDREFLNSFEQCSLGSKCWTHEAHVRMAWLLLLVTPSFKSALIRIKAGIQRFNSANNSIGYHETITVAFATLLDSKRQPDETFQQFKKRNPDLLSKNCLKKYYSDSALKSEIAKHQFVEPDLEALPVPDPLE